MKTDKKILVVSTVIFIALLMLAFYLLSNFAIAINIVLLGVIILAAPYTIYRFFEFKRIRSYEDIFPSFLRDLAESQRAGLTLIQSIQSASKSDYGSLTKEIQKINNQLSWNIQLEIVLKNFSERMARSKIIIRAVMIIDQANKSGGNIEDTMESLAYNIESIKDVQKEKAVLLNQQVIMMYAIFFIFLGITLALIKFLIPMLKTNVDVGSLGTYGFTGFNSNPCSPCIDGTNPSCFGCDLFSGVSATFDFGDKTDPAAYYKSLFFMMIMVQGLFSGLIAGQIGSDSVVAGVKHSLLMLLVGFIVFMLVTRLGIV